MDFYVDFSCEDNSETGRTKLTVSDFDDTSIRDVKHAIQDTIQAPVCDQQLFYQGQPVTDDDMPLSRLYFREGDCFKLQFLAVADIQGMSERIDVLKNSAQKIVEKFQRQPPRKLTAEDSSGSISQLFYNQLVLALHDLCNYFFFPWKCLRSVAHRHFFVQEGGFDAFLEVFKFSRRLHLVDNVFNVSPMEGVNQWQCVLCRCCLHVLWNFGETIQDLKLIMSKRVLPLIIDALLLQPYSPQETTLTSNYGLVAVTDEMIVYVNEGAVGCCSGLVEYNPNIQEQVSNMPRLIDKLLFMIDRCQSGPVGYSLSSSQVASNTLFHCTYNVKSAQPLVDCGALAKMINITKKLLIDNDGDTALRYYCCLFLGRMRSAPLVRLDIDTCVAIDELIDEFLDSHVPDEISEWEKKMSTIWMDISPLVHLAFAAGKEYYFHNDMKGISQDGYQINNDQRCELKEEACFKESKLSKTSIPEHDAAKSGDMQKSQSACSSPLDSDSREEILPNISESMKIRTSSMSENEDCVITGRKDHFTWPGSASTQRLGIFSLAHTLSIKENLQMASSENLHPYLVCLLWHLKHNEGEKLRTAMENFHNIPLPSLKVAAKSVLAIVYGLDMVFKL